ncbi:MAG: PEP-CTERM sorting domain-containing protein [Verrucomicrobiota bacterium]
MNTPLRSILATTSLALALIAPQLNAATLPLNINFNADDGTAHVNDFGVYQWNNGGGSWSITTSTDAGMGSGNVARNSGGGVANTRLYIQWDPVTLTNVGDSLTVSLLFRSVLSADTSNNFQLALVDSNQTALAADPTFNAPANNDPMNLATGFGYRLTTTGPAVQVIEYVGTSSTSGSTPVVNDTIAGSQALIFNTVAQTLSYTLTKTATGVSMSVASSSGYSFSNEQLSAGTLDFDTFMLRAGVASYVDDISISYASNIPEPSTAALLVGAGMLTLAGVGRRRRG